MSAILGPLPCRACRRIVRVDHDGTAFRVLELHAKGWRPHVCPKA